MKDNRSSWPIYATKHTLAQDVLLIEGVGRCEIWTQATLGLTKCYYQKIGRWFRQNKANYANGGIKLGEFDE